MSVRPTEMASASTISPTDLLDLVTRFSTEIGAMTDLGALSERIIQELCRVGGTTHGALYLLDREHEHFRRAGLVGLAAESCFPGTLALTHTIPQHLSSSLQTAPGMTEPHNGCRAALDDALAAMRAGRNLPHVSRGRLIAFSLLGGNRTHEHDATPIVSLLNALAQTATNALDTSMLLEDLHRSHALMKRTDRLRSLEIMAGGFAHEIRNPLTSIKTFIQLAPQRQQDALFISEFSRLAIEDVHRIERLLHEILDYASYMTPQPSDVDLNELVTSCLCFISASASQRGTCL